MSEKPKPDDDDQRRTDDVLRRLLHTPPQPFTPKKEPTTKPKKPAKK